jgi:hypothetical protein
MCRPQAVGVKSSDVVSIHSADVRRKALTDLVGLNENRAKECLCRVESVVNDPLDNQVEERLDEGANEYRPPE